MRISFIKFLGLLLLMFAIYPICISCSADEDASKSEEYAETEFIPESETKNYMVSGVDVEDDGDTISLCFSCNKSWTAKSSEDWCSLSVAKGKSGNNRLQIIVAPNTMLENRDAIVTIGFNDKNYYFIVRQEAARCAVLNNEHPGKLSGVLGENYLKIEELKLSGSLNGIDIALIIDMGINGELAVLDLSEASIVEGGTYNSSFPDVSVETKNNEITDYMFVRFNNLTDLILPKNVIKIGKSSIWICPKLSNIVLPNTLKSIDDQGISYVPVTKLELPEGLESLGACALVGLDKLTSITLPSTLSSLGAFPFEGTGLKEIHMRSLTPPTCVMINEQNDILNLAILYVPRGCGGLYGMDSEWGKFKTIIEE